MSGQFGLRLNVPVESRILGFVLVESGILGFGIWHTAQGIRNPTNDSGFTTSFPGLFPLKKLGPGNEVAGSADKECAIEYLESGLHGVESRIRDCLGFPYMGRLSP